MPNDSTYVVGISFAVDDLKLPALSSRVSSDLFKPATAGLKSELSGIGDAVSKIGSGLSDAFTGAVEKAGDIAMTLGKLGIGAAIGAAAYGVAGLNNELEQTNLSLAAIFNAQGFSSNFGDAMGLAADQVAKMKVDVKSLPGDLGQLAAIMKTIATPAAQGGADPDKIRSLAGRGMLVGQILGVQQDMVARELAMLLSGRAGAHNVLGTRLGLTGDAAKKFNGESAGDRVKDIGAAFDKYGPAADAFGKSWVANTTTLKDNIKYALLAPATSPLFESVKKTVAEINGWFDHNGDKVHAFTNRLGAGLAEAFDRGKSMVLEWWPAIDTFAENAYSRIIHIWEKAQPYVEQFGETVRNALADPATIDRIESALKLYAALKIGGVVSGAVSPMVGPMMGMLGGGGAAGGEAAAGLGGVAEGIGALSAAAGPVAIGLAAVAGAFDDIVNSSSDFYTEANADVTSFEATMKGAFGDLKAIGTDVTPVLREIVDVLGISLLAVLHQIEESPLVKMGLKQLHTAREIADDFGTTADGPNVRGKDKARSMKALQFEFGKDDLNYWQKAPKLPTNMSVTTNNYVTMTISGAEEPSRIARIVTQKLGEMARYPTSSRYGGTNYLTGRRA